MPSLEALMKNIPPFNKGYCQSRSMVNSKAKGEKVKKNFATSNLCYWVDIDHFVARICIYWNTSVEKKDGMSKEDEKRLINWK